MKEAEFISCCGIDEKTDLERADWLAVRFPLEWGIMIGDIDALCYPSVGSIKSMLQIRGTKALYLYGSKALDYVKEQLLPEGLNAKDISKIDRIIVQDLSFKDVKKFNQKYKKKLVITCDSEFYEDESIDYLFDKNTNKSFLSTSVPSLRSNRLVGYAGGIDFRNVKAFVQNIRGEGSFWLQLGSRIRTNGKFDLAKVEWVCQELYCNNNI